eukprot:Gb_03888 [translate_table: standard]
MESFEPLSKKFRPYDATTTTDTNNNNDNINIINNGNNMLLSVPPPAMPVFPGSFPAEHEAAQVFYQPNGGDLECRRYSTPEGCPYGTGCRFKHGPNGVAWHIFHQFPSCVILVTTQLSLYNHSFLVLFIAHIPILSWLLLSCHCSSWLAFVTGHRPISSWPYPFLSQSICFLSLEREGFSLLKRHAFELSNGIVVDTQQANYLPLYKIDTANIVNNMDKIQGHFEESRDRKREIKGKMDSMEAEGSQIKNLWRTLKCKQHYPASDMSSLHDTMSTREVQGMVTCNLSLLICFRSSPQWLKLLSVERKSFILQEFSFMNEDLTNRQLEELKQVRQVTEARNLKKWVIISNSKAWIRVSPFSGWDQNLSCSI